MMLLRSLKSIIYCIAVKKAAACSTVRIDADVGLATDDPGTCPNCAQDSSSTSFQARTMEIDRAMISTDRTNVDGVTSSAYLDGMSYVETFPTTNGEEVLQECSPFIEWKWERKIPSVAITMGGNIVGKSIRSITEGMNLNGLTVSVQLFRGNQFPVPALTKTEVVEKKAIPDICLAVALLSSYSTVDEIMSDFKEGGPLHYVYSWVFGDPLGVGFHWVVDDAKGNHVLIEFRDGSPKFWNTTSIKVVTNDPAFDWHVANINNYAITSAVVEVNPLLVVDDETFGKVPQVVGTGMNTRAIPGDFTSASRFQKLFLLNRLRQTAVPSESFAENFAAANALISSVFIPWGTVAGEIGEEKGHYEWTEWTVIKCYGGGHRKFYYKGYFDTTWKVVDLTKVDVRTNEKAEINPIGRKPGIEELGVVDSPIIGKERNRKNLKGFQQVGTY